MSENKEYYYMRLKENFFDEDSLKIIESIPGDGVYYEIILLKLYLQSLRTNGKLLYRDRIPYNIQMLSAVTNQSEAMVRSAMQLFQNMGLIEILDNGAIYMMDIQNYIGKSSSEADRKRNYRIKIEDEKQQCLGQMSTIPSGQMSQNVGQMSLLGQRQMSLNLGQMSTIPSGQMSLLNEKRDICPTNWDKNPPEIRDKRLEYIDIRANKDLHCSDFSDSDEPKIDYQNIVEKYNAAVEGTGVPSIKRLTDARKKKIKTRLEYFTEEQIFEAFDKIKDSDFLMGKAKNSKWKVNFDWFFKNDSNLLKVLEGNFDGHEMSSKITINSEQREGYVDDIFGEYLE